MNKLLFRYYAWRWRRHNAKAPVSTERARNRLARSIRGEPVRPISGYAEWAMKSTKLFEKSMLFKGRSS